MALNLVFLLRETISAIGAEASKAYDEVKKIPSVENDAKYFQDLKTFQSHSIPPQSLMVA